MVIFLLCCIIKVFKPQSILCLQLLKVGPEALLFLIFPLLFWKLFGGLLVESVLMWTKMTLSPCIVYFMRITVWHILFCFYDRPAPRPAKWDWEPRPEGKNESSKDGKEEGDSPNASGPSTSAGPEADGEKEEKKSKSRSRSRSRSHSGTPPPKKEGKGTPSPPPVGIVKPAEKRR